MTEYIKCGSCKNWEDSFRIKKTCQYCNNSKLVKAPKENLCNNCGNSMHFVENMNDIYPHGLYEASVTGSFDSYHLFDCTKYTFSLCEKCLREMFNLFVIKPKITGIDVIDEEITTEQIWSKDQKDYEYRVWIDNGGHHQAFLHKKCNNIKDCPNKAAYTLLYLDQDFSENCLCEEHAVQYKKNTHYKLIGFISNNLKAFL